MRYDQDARVVVVQHRDTETGKVSQQFPSEEAVRDLRLSVITGAPLKPAREKAASDPQRDSDRVSLTV
jgi:hypothetical protein